MEISRPIITYFGKDVQVPEQMEQLIEHDLPQEGIEWKRPYKRQIKTVYLEAKFEKFASSQSKQQLTSSNQTTVSALTSQQLPLNQINSSVTHSSQQPNNGNNFTHPLSQTTPKTIVDQAQTIPSNNNAAASSMQLCFEKQFLHTYWIECYDIEMYRAHIKDDLLVWVQQFSRQPISEWLIVLIDNQERRSSKSKLLSRSSVVDKIRADFPASLKHMIDQHLVILTDPLKHESKSAESYSMFLHKIRNLLLSAYTKQLAIHEDHIRSQREKRNIPRWDFFRFFLAQEELAFAFELLGLFDEALVQYDELDALFSQFILNSNVDQMPAWLRELSHRCNVWHGLCLSNQLSRNLRDSLISNNGNLLDFRNYLFARQCELLLLQHKPWEVASRSLPFLQNCVNELNILEIKLLPGAISCWVYLSALEILLKCERYNDSSQMDAYSRYTIGIRAYARTKLRELGELSGLMPGMTTAPDHLHYVVSLISGMGEDHHFDPTTPSPQSRLKECLSNQEAFLNSYLEFSELTMGTYKHIGRLREARLIGRELSALYIKLKKYNQSLVFLQDMEKVFLTEKWNMLLFDTRKKIYRCYELLDEKDKQLKYALLLAASCLNMDERHEFYQKAVELASTGSKHKPLCIRMNEILNLRDLMLKGSNGPIVTNQKIKMAVKLQNNLISDICLEKISLLLDSSLTSHYDLTFSSNPAVFGKTASTSNIRQTKVSSLATIDEAGPQFLTFHATTVGVRCSNSPNVLKRSDSNSGFSLDKDPVREKHDYWFSASNVKLQPGCNEIELEFESKHSYKFKVKQLIAEWKPNIMLVNDVFKNQVCFDVYSQEVKVELDDEQQPLVAGVEHPLKLIFNTGSHYFVNKFETNIKCQSGIKIKASDVSSSTDLHNADDIWLDELQFRLDQSFAPFEKISIPLIVKTEFADLQKFSILKFNLQLSFCPADAGELQVIKSLNFLPPFISAFNLHTCADRKFIEVLVKGCCDHVFKVCNPRLQIQNSAYTGVICQFLGDAQRMDWVFNGEFVHYMWQLNSSTNLANSQQLDFEFSIDYQPRDSLTAASKSAESASKNELKTYLCTFSRSNFTTLYFIRAAISPQNSEFCRVGNLCSLSVIIERNEQSTDLIEKQQSSIEYLIMFELVIDKNLWNVNGRSAGILTKDQAQKCELNFELMPLCSGFLPLPNVSLFKISRYLKSSNEAAEAEASETKASLDDKAPEQSSTVPIIDSSIVSFEQGQVYNSSRGMQVNVLPSSGLITADA